MDTQNKKPSIEITKQPQNQTLTISSKNTNLSVVANVINPVLNQNLTYQWWASDVDPATASTTNVINWTKIDGATNSTYNIDLGSDNALWQTKWYKCDINYKDAATVTSNIVFVKMTLTEEQAKTTLNEWLGVVDNQRAILTQFFSNQDVNKKSYFYSGDSVLDGIFINQLPDFKIYELTYTDNPNGAPGLKGIPTWNVLLRTTTLWKFKTYNNTTGFDNEKNIEIGSEFNFWLPYSFGKNRSLTKTDGGSFIMDFKSSVKTGYTSLSWSPSEIGAVIKSNTYIFRLNDLKTQTNHIVTSIIKPKSLDGIDSTNYKFIPTFNII